MAYTIGSEPWGYLPLLNECIKILLSVAFGAVMGYFQIFDATTFVPLAVKFVFHVALPLHILRGIGVVVNFYDPRFQWMYIVAFLVLRVLALLLCVAWVLAASQWGRYKSQQGIGQVAVLWLTLTWISTVILGVPISKAVFGSEALGLFYGLLAGVSSFIFQLPVQLLFLECHTLGLEYATQTSQESSGSVEQESPAEENVDVEDEPSLDLEQAPEENKDGSPASPHEREEPVVEQTVFPPVLWLQFARRGDVWKRVARKVLTNPVIWGIAGGFFLSLTTLGPKYLNPASPEFVPGLGWFFEFTAWFGNFVTPLSLFTMGVWAQSQGRRLFRVPLHAAILSMFSKLVLVPLLMVGLAKLCRLTDEAGRAAVLIACLPISMASFSLGGHYEIGEALLAENVALGTALMLPTVLIWNWAMDEIGLFPI